jgi:6-phosphofructokinase
MRMAKSKTRCVGILTAGGDCPGLNAAIRGVGKAATEYGIEIVGIFDGFRGLVENRARLLGREDFSGILATGGTMLGTSRDKPNSFRMASGQVVDMTAAAIENYHRLHLDCLVCLGGNGTQRTAYKLAKEGGINVLTLPKTIDNDVVETDVTFGYDTALTIATEAIDRLHSTAESHHRLMVVQVMGNRSGWLALGAGVAGGADVILIPEIPYDINAISDAVIARDRGGKRFSIVAVAEGAIPEEPEEKKGQKKRSKDKSERAQSLPSVHDSPEAAYTAERIAHELQELSGLEARVTVLGHVQRGGPPTARDRLLATELGAKAAELLAEGTYGVMVAVQGSGCGPVPLEKVAGERRCIPSDHPLILSARNIGTCLGDRWPK